MAIENVSLNNALNERKIIGNTIFEQDLGTIKVLVAWVSTNTYATFRVQGTTTGYQVPVSKRFRSIALRHANFAGSAQDRAGIASGTNNVGFDSATEPTGTDFTNPQTLGTLPAYTIADVSDIYIFPAGVYPYYHANKNSICWLFGYEE